MGYTPGQQLGGVTVQLGSVLLGMVDGAGVAWTINSDGLQGWDSADVRTQYTDRQADHGSWAGPTYLAARVITLAGTIVAPSQGALYAAMDQLSAAVALADTLLTVNEPVARQAVVRRSGKLLLAPVTDRIATYSALLTAADPRRYSTTLQGASTGLPIPSGGLTAPVTAPVVVAPGTPSGEITLTNTGSITTLPVLTLTGPLTPPTAVLVQYPDGSVRQLVYSDALVAGDVLVLDCQARTAILNAAVSRRRYLSGPWPDVPPGATVTIQWTSAGSDPAALLTGTCRSAWM